jgi:hypothetical protein
MTLRHAHRLQDSSDNGDANDGASVPNAAPFLLYTTRDNILHAQPLTGPASSTAGSNGQLAGAGPGLVQQLNGASVGVAHDGKASGEAGSGRVPCATRAIESGALLVACPAGSSTVILQMPRGNLEGVDSASCLNLLKAMQRSHNGRSVQPSSAPGKRFSWFAFLCHLLAAVAAAARCMSSVVCNTVDQTTCFAAYRRAPADALP